MTFSKLTWLKRLRSADLTDAEFRVLVILHSYTDKEGNNAFPGNTRLGQECGMHTRSIRRIMRRLEDKGWIAERLHGGNEYGKARANVYDLVRNPDAYRSKGDPGVPKGDPTVRKGDPGVSSKGDSTVPPSDHLYQSMHIRSSDHSAPDAAASPTPRAGATWQAMRDDFDMLDDYLQTNVGYLDARASGLALAMWEKGSHPLAILNAVNAERFAG